MSRESEDKIHCDTNTSNEGDDKSDEGPHPRNLRSQLNAETTAGPSQLLETDADVLKTESGQDESAGATSSGLRNQQSQTAQCSTSRNTPTLASSRPLAAGVGTRPSGNIPRTQPMTVAFEYINRMKDDQPEIYTNFLVIMDEFKFGRICAEETMRRACIIFKDHTEFIHGFNMFLPPGYKILIQYNDQGIAELVVSVPSPPQPPLYNTWSPPSSPIRKQQMALYDQWRQNKKSKANNTSSSANNGNLRANVSQPVSAGEVAAGADIGAAPAVGEDGLTVYVLTSNFIAANLCRQRNPLTNRLRAQNACKYLKQVQNRYRDQIQNYYTFLDIMRQFRSRRLNFPDLVRSLCYLFKDYTILIYNFNIFLRPGNGIEIFSNQGTSVALVWMTSPSGYVSCVNAYKIPKVANEPSPSNLHNTQPPQQEQSPSDAIIVNHDHSSENRERNISQSESIAGPSTSNSKNDLNNQSEADQLSKQNETVEQQNQPVEFNHEIPDDNNVKKN